MIKKIINKLSTDCESNTITTNCFFVGTNKFEDVEWQWQYKKFLGLFMHSFKRIDKFGTEFKLKKMYLNVAEY